MKISAVFLKFVLTSLLGNGIIFLQYKFRGVFYLMDKNNILEKAKKENKFGDERYRQVYLQASQLGMSVGMLLCGIVLFVDLLLHSETTWTSLVALVIQMGMQGTLYTALAIQCKKRRDIIMACLFIVLLIVFVALLIVFFVTGRII